jgi:hypothetical protein
MGTRAVEDAVGPEAAAEAMIVEAGAGVLTTGAAVEAALVPGNMIDTTLAATTCPPVIHV